MLDLTELKRQQEKALQRYQETTKALELAQQDEYMFPLLAQKLNDDWLALKAANLEVENYVVMKQLGDLYGVRHETHT